MAPAKPVASVARHAYQDDQGSQNAPSSPPSDTIAVGWRAPPSRRSSLQYGVADAPRDAASNKPPLLQQIAREHSNSLGDTTEPTNQIRLHEPRPSEQVAHACEYLYDANRRDSTIVSPATRGFQIPALATTAALVNHVLESSQKKPHSGHLPLVKLLVYGYHKDCYSAADIEDFTAVCLKCVKGLFADNIRIYPGRGPKGKEFDWFFDPDGIAPGGLLILCITGHGKPTEEGVELRTDRAGPMLMDTFDLHTAINGLKVPCTLEIVLATCYSEAVISGLDRLLAMKSPEASKVLPPPNKFLFKSLHPGNLIPRLDTQATVIVWAAADGGPAYSEADLPTREGKNDIVIGAMCRALESAAGGVSRRVLFGKVQEAVTEYNTARDMKYHSKSKEDQEEAYKSRTYRGPQLACLLSSAENKELILNSPAFQAL